MWFRSGSKFKVYRTDLPLHTVPVANEAFYAAAGAGAGGPVAERADRVLIFNGTGYDTYFYQQGRNLPTGWRKSLDALTDAGATEIPAGGALILQRRGAAFLWRAPSPAATAR